MLTTASGIGSDLASSAGNAFDECTADYLRRSERDSDDGEE